MKRPLLRRLRPPVRFGRPQDLETDCSRVRRWQSRCGRFRVEYHEPFLGGPEAYRPYWLVLRRKLVSYGHVWVIVSRHRKRRRAFEQARKLANRVPCQGGLFHARAYASRRREAGASAP